MFGGRILANGARALQGGATSWIRKTPDQRHSSRSVWLSRGDRGVRPRSGPGVARNPAIGGRATDGMPLRASAERRVWLAGAASAPYHPELLVPEGSMWFATDRDTIRGLANLPLGRIDLRSASTP